jgi:CMP-N-acetylneuraminic acid synthetase
MNTTPDASSLRIVGLVLARIGSKRLVRKNVLSVAGRPMFIHALEALRASNLITDVFLSTESDEIKNLASRLHWVRAIDRPVHLAEDNVRTQEVFKHFAGEVDFDILVSVQANSPQVRTENIDRGISLLLDKNLWEVRSVNDEGLENGAFWILRRKTVFWDGLSVYFGVVQDNAIDVHTEADLERVRREMR